LAPADDREEGPGGQQNLPFYLPLGELLGLRKKKGECGDLTEPSNFWWESCRQLRREHTYIYAVNRGLPGRVGKRQYGKKEATRKEKMRSTSISREMNGAGNSFPRI